MAYINYKCRDSGSIDTVEQGTIAEMRVLMQDYKLMNNAHGYYYISQRATAAHYRSVKQ